MPVVGEERATADGRRLIEDTRTTKVRGIRRQEIVEPASERISVAAADIRGSSRARQVSFSRKKEGGGYGPSQDSIGRHIGGRTFISKGWAALSTGAGIAAVPAKGVLGP